MSSLTKSLEKRIQELISSIDSQKNELAAYESVLALETGKLQTSHELETASEESHTKPEPAMRDDHASGMPTPMATPDLSDLEFTGNKTNLVVAIVGRHGETGATPKEVDAVFTTRKVARSKNLIYNTLSYLVTRKKLVRREGRYYAVGVKRGASTNGATAPKKRRKMSAAGIKRIREANQKRWAAKRATDAAAAKSGVKASKKK